MESVSSFSSTNKSFQDNPSISQHRRYSLYRSSRFACEDAYFEQQHSQQLIQKASLQNSHFQTKKDKSCMKPITVRIIATQFDSQEQQQVGDDMYPSHPPLRKRELSIDSHSQFHQSIQFSPIQRWLLLIFCAICNALVPIWMTVDVKSQSLTRAGWRIFMLSMMMIPFVKHEQRNTDKPQQKFRQLLRAEYLKKIYLSSFNYAIWITFSIIAVRLTARAHSFSLMRTRFFFTTLRKLYNKHECHEGEIGGLLLVAFGIAMFLWDSVTLPTEEVPMAKYLSFPWWKRVAGDLFAITGCLTFLFLEKKCELPKGPRFSTLMIYYLFVSLNLITFGFYLGGTEFSLDPRWGVFGLFTSTNFVGVFYVSIMLGVNFVVANVLVINIFSQVIRSIAACFQIVIAITIYHMLSIEQVKTGTTMIGVCFLVPGIMMIVGGQGTLNKLEMKINSQIYTSEKLVLSKNQESTEFILKPLHVNKKVSHKQSSLQKEIKKDKSECDFKTKDKQD